MNLKVVLFFLFFVLFSCNKKEESTVAAPAITGDKAQLLAFLNPDGAPCQMQMKILNDLSSKVQGKVDIKNILTTNDSDTTFFYQYGIRGLPSLILIDSKGTVIKRFSPGVQEEREILEAVDGLNARS